MKVVALSKGFYGGSPRRAGEHFEVPDGSKAAWYAPVDSAAATAAAKPKAGKVKAQPDTLSQMGKEPAQSMTEQLA